MPLYDYLTADVFTARRFGGNPLAVLTDARGLTDAQMLAITREFNYSETVFVLPPDDARHERRLRIFTPGGEVPFAGHPTVGTAYLLAATGAISLRGEETTIVFEEGVGPVSVMIRVEHGTPVFAQLSVAQLPAVVMSDLDQAALAAMLGLAPEDLLDDPYRPEAVSCGLPFLLVPVRDRGAVARARIVLELWEQTLRGTPGSEIMVFAMDAEADDADVRARVFVPGLSVPEDPATGSACAALGGYLAQRTPRDDGTLRWTVEQGVEMGRPSRIEVEVDKRGGAVTAVRVGGAAVQVMEGKLRVGARD